MCAQDWWGSTRRDPSFRAAQCSSRILLLFFSFLTARDRRRRRGSHVKETKGDPPPPPPRVMNKRGGRKGRRRGRIRRGFPRLPRGEKEIRGNLEKKNRKEVVCGASGFYSFSAFLMSVSPRRERGRVTKRLFPLELCWEMMAPDFWHRACSYIPPRIFFPCSILLDRKAPFSALAEGQWESIWGAGCERGRWNKQRHPVSHSFQFATRFGLAEFPPLFSAAGYWIFSPPFSPFRAAQERDWCLGKWLSFPAEFLPHQAFALPDWDHGTFWLLDSLRTSRETRKSGGNFPLFGSGRR